MHHSLPLASNDAYPPFMLKMMNAPTHHTPVQMKDVHFADVSEEASFLTRSKDTVSRRIMQMKIWTGAAIMELP